MNLNQKDWKEFRLGEIFTPQYGVNMELQNCTPSCSENSINFVARTADNNGVVATVEIIKGIEPQKAGTITCAAGGSVLSTFVQTKDFYSGRDLYLLIPKENISLEAKLFCCTIISQNKYRYNYGRQANKTLKDIRLKLPAINEKPDWAFMEKYIKSLKHKPVSTKIATISEFLDVSTWKEYRLDDLFHFKKGSRLIKEDMEDGDVNYLGAISVNNGVRQKIKCDDSDLYEPNCITVNYNGSVGEAFYQKESFWASDDVNILYSKGWEMNQYNALFIITVIKADRYRFNYGRKWTLEKMKETIIKLPAKIDNSPNFSYMESYIRSLPYSDRI